MLYLSGMYYFNSIKVQLNQHHNENEGVYHQFQFHKGTIKSLGFANDSTFLPISIP